MTHNRQRLNKSQPQLTLAKPTKRQNEEGNRTNAIRLGKYVDDGVCAAMFGYRPCEATLLQHKATLFWLLWSCPEFRMCTTQQLVQPKQTNLRQHVGSTAAPHAPYGVCHNFHHSIRCIMLALQLVCTQLCEHASVSSDSLCRSRELLCSLHTS